MQRCDARKILGVSPWAWGYMQLPFAQLTTLP
jgi:hypothetical protein